MRYFPIFRDLEGAAVLIAGGGEEALRKIRLLQRTPARLLVVAESLDGEIAANPRVTWIARNFTPDLLDGVALAISAGGAAHDIVAAAATARGIPVNVVDRPDLSTFIVPSIVDRDPVVIAIGTEGTAPVLGQSLRARIDALLPVGLGALARTAAKLRPRAAAAIPAGNLRRAFWQRLLSGDLAAAHLAGEHLAFRNGVDHLLANASTAPLARISFLDSGPGEPDLLTLRAQRKLQEADVIIHDRAVPDAVLELARRDARRIAAPFDFTAVASLLIAEAMAGHAVVRLRQGPALAEELTAAAAEGLAVETVPGIAAAPTPIVLFPIRENVRATSIRAAS